MDVQNFSPFYWTSSPAGAAAQKERWIDRKTERVRKRKRERERDGERERKRRERERGREGERTIDNGRYTYRQTNRMKIILTKSMNGKGMNAGRSHKNK